MQHFVHQFLISAPGSSGNFLQELFKELWSDLCHWERVATVGSGHQQALVNFNKLSQFLIRGCFRFSFPADSLFWRATHFSSECQGESYITVYAELGTEGCQRLCCSQCMCVVKIMNVKCYRAWSSTSHQSRSLWCVRDDGILWLGATRMTESHFWGWRR